MNRIQIAIDNAAVKIAEKNLPKEKLDQMHKNLDMAFDEYCTFQELKSVAMLQNLLTLDEANTVYGYLGNIPDQFNEQPLAVKIILTKLYAELLDVKIKGKRKI